MKVEDVDLLISGVDMFLRIIWCSSWINGPFIAADGKVFLGMTRLVPVVFSLLISLLLSRGLVLMGRVVVVAPW